MLAPTTLDIETIDTRPDAPVATFTFQQPDPAHLNLEGTLDGHKIHMETRLFDRNKLLLVSRGFNWIQERPFNR